MMNEKERDKELHIQTAGTLELLNQSPHYNRYEATPYEALDALFEAYSPERKEGFVDYGCGKGRVSFYAHRKFGMPVTGVEMNGRLYADAVENLVRYRRKNRYAGGSIRFERMLAEAYPVAQTDRCFYFFNPFSVQVFMTVIRKILRVQEAALDKGARDVILYYPTADYVQFMEHDTPFELLQEVPVAGLYEQNDNERFLIYRVW